MVRFYYSALADDGFTLNQRLLTSSRMRLPALAESNPARLRRGQYGPSPLNFVEFGYSGIIVEVK